MSARKVPVEILEAARSRHSQDGLIQLRDFVALNPGALFTALPAIYHHLDPGLIPLSLDASAETIQSLELAALSLITLFHKRADQILDQNRVFSSVIATWPMIWRWVDFLVANNAPLALLPRKTALELRLAVLVTCRDGIDVAPFELSTPIVVRTIIAFWTSESDSSKTDLSEQMDYENSSASVVYPMLASYDGGTKVIRQRKFNRSLITAVEESVDEVSVAALSRLRYSISSPFVSGADFISVYYDLRIVEGLMKCSLYVFHGMLSRGLIPLITSLLLSITSKPFRDQSAETTVKVICCSILLIVSAAQSPYNNLWYLQAFEGRILLGLFGTVPWIQWEKAQQGDSVIGLSTSELIKLMIMPLIHLEVYRAARRSLAEIVRGRLTNGVDLDDMAEPWLQLKDLIRERTGAYDLSMRPKCSNRTCSSTGVVRKRCIGCMAFYYCSKACQRYDWLHGEHRQMCLDLQQSYRSMRDESGLIVAKAEDFMIQVAQWKLHANFDEYEEAIRAIRPPAVPIFELDHCLQPEVFIVPSTESDIRDEGFLRNVDMASKFRDRLIIVSVLSSTGSACRQAHRLVPLPGAVFPNESNFF